MHGMQVTAGLESLAARLRSATDMLTRGVEVVEANTMSLATAAPASATAAAASSSPGRQQQALVETLSLLAQQLAGAAQPPPLAMIT